MFTFHCRNFSISGRHLMVVPVRLSQGTWIRLPERYILWKGQESNPDLQPVPIMIDTGRRPNRWTTSPMRIHRPTTRPYHSCLPFVPTTTDNLSSATTHFSTFNPPHASSVLLVSQTAAMLPHRLLEAPQSSRDLRLHISYIPPPITYPPG